MRKKLLELFFKKEIAIIDATLKSYQDAIAQKDSIIIDLSKQIKPQLSFEDMMREAINIPINFYDVDEDGNPQPHYLNSLSEEARKVYVANLETIYTDEKFQNVVSYVISLIGNTSMQTVPEENMRNGRYAIIGIRMLMNEFKKAHNEHIANSKVESEEFDKNSVIPE